MPVADEHADVRDEEERAARRIGRAARARGAAVKTPRVALAGVTALVAILAGGGAAAAAPAKRPVARWHVDTVVSCAEPRTCKLLPAWIARLHNPVDIVSFSDGSNYYRAQVIAVGRSGPRRCGTSLFAKPFTGECRVSDFGIGSIAPSAADGPWKGKPDFWVSSETAMFRGSPALSVDPFPPYPIDTGNPALPGTWTTAELAGAVPAGNSIRSVVTRVATR